MENATKNITEDAKLVKLVVNGKKGKDEIAKKRSEEAFETLFGKYKNQLIFRFRMQSGLNDAEDFLLKTFEKAYLKIESYKPQYAFSTWLYKIATNLAIDNYRKTKDENIVNLESLAVDDGEGHYMEYPIEDEAPPPDELMIAEERAKLVRAAVDKIQNETIREMVILRFFKEMSYEEIAEAINTPIGTVKGNLNRAKNDLYQILLSMNKSLVLP